MIKWIRARLYHGVGDERLTAHLFECGNRHFVIKKLKKGSYEPFDCLVLTLADAISLRNFLDGSIRDFKHE